MLFKAENDLLEDFVVDFDSEVLLYPDEKDDESERTRNGYR